MLPRKSPGLAMISIQDPSWFPCLVYKPGNESAYKAAYPTTLQFTIDVMSLNDVVPAAISSHAAGLFDQAKSLPWNA